MNVSFLVLLCAEGLCLLVAEVAIHWRFLLMERGYANFIQYPFPLRRFPHYSKAPQSRTEISGTRKMGENCLTPVSLSFWWVELCSRIKLIIKIRHIINVLVLALSIFPWTAAIPLARKRKENDGSVAKGQHCTCCTLYLWSSHWIVSNGRLRCDFPYPAVMTSVKPAN